MSFHESFGDYNQSFYLGPSLLVAESPNFHCLCDTKKERISSKGVFLQGSCCALWFISETLAWQAHLAHILLFWEVRRITWESFHSSPQEKVLLPRDVLGCWEDPRGFVWFVTSPVGDLCLSVGTAGSELSSAWQAQMDRVHKAAELSCWSLLLAQQFFKWHSSVWVCWELLGNAAPSWILLPCRLEVLKCLLLPHEEREKKMREVEEGKKEKSPGRLGVGFLTQQGMWNTWEWWELFLCVADSPAVNPALQQRRKEKF